VKLSKRKKEGDDGTASLGHFCFLETIFKIDFEQEIYC